MIRIQSCVGVRSLAPQHRPHMLAHLLALSHRDRCLRFGYPASDEHVRRYVDSLRFEDDELFGVFGQRMEVLALAHLACPAGHDAGAGADAAEFGISVREQERGRGIGTRLFGHAVQRARKRGIATLVIYASSENTPMLRIVRNAGATLKSSRGESEARLHLHAESPSSRAAQLVRSGAVSGFQPGLRFNPHLPIEIPSC